uniref:Uncharacterized protein n=1 Tax=Candidozyma auris TaxID=498019 RepID=A0A0L0NX91_CANAR
MEPDHWELEMPEQKAQRHQLKVQQGSAPGRRSWAPTYRQWLLSSTWPPCEYRPKERLCLLASTEGEEGGDQGPVGEAEVVGVGQPWLSREEVVLEDVDVEDNGDS